jgi:hypothetical protein
LVFWYAGGSFCWTLCFYEMHLSDLYNAVSSICSERSSQKSVRVPYDIYSAVSGN